MYSIDFDEGTGVLHVSTGGFWSPQDADRFCQELSTRAQDVHRKAGHLRLLIDGTESQVQKPEVTDGLATLAAALIRSPKDRIAVVLGSSLVKIQAERILRSDQTKAFLSNAAAREWLLPEQ